MEVIDSVIFSQLIMVFEARLEKIFKQLELISSPVKCWQRCGKQFWQLGNSVDIVMEN